MNKLTIVCGLVLFAQLPLLLNRARNTDEACDRKILSWGDISGYQAIAVNLLHGKGLSLDHCLPVETYQISELKPKLQEELAPCSWTWYRAPGFPALLAASYSLFGNRTIVTRTTMATITWGTGFLLLFIGIHSAGQLGAVAGTMTALFTMHFQPELSDLFLGHTSETPTAFLLAAWMLFLIKGLRAKRMLPLFLSALSLLGCISVRPSYLVLLAPTLTVLLLRQTTRRRVVLYISVVFIPLIMWSSHASYDTGSFVLLTQQPNANFPQFNHRYVLEGGPFPPGVWNPRPILKDDSPVPDAAALDWARSEPLPAPSGFSYWIEEWRSLPKLFFVKLRAGFFYNLGLSSLPYRVERLHLAAIGFLLAALGFRQRKKQLLRSPLWSEASVFTIQLGLLSVLLAGANQIPFALILALWTLILVLALLLPYGTVWQPKQALLDLIWASLCLLLCHAVLIISFGAALGQRFQRPIDPFVVLVGLIGIGFTGMGTVKSIYSLGGRIKNPLKCVWLIASIFLIIDITVLVLVSRIPSSITAQWLEQNLPKSARVIVDSVANDVLGQTSDHRWLITFNQYDVPPVPDETDYLILDERQSQLDFNTRIKKLEERNARVIYESNNLFGIGLRQTVLAAP